MPKLGRTSIRSFGYAIFLLAIGHDAASAVPRGGWVRVPGSNGLKVNLDSVRNVQREIAGGGFKSDLPQVDTQADVIIRGKVFYGIVMFCGKKPVNTEAHEIKYNHKISDRDLYLTRKFVCRSRPK